MCADVTTTATPTTTAIGPTTTTTTGSASATGATTTPTTNSDARNNKHGHQHQQQHHQASGMMNARMNNNNRTDVDGVNEIRVKASGQMKAYIDYAKKSLDSPGCDTLRVVAVGSAIAKAISIAEILKRQYDTLDQVNSLTRFHPDPNQPHKARNNNNNNNHTTSPHYAAASQRRITSCLTIDLTKNAHHIHTHAPSDVDVNGNNQTSSTNGAAVKIDA